MKKNMKKKEWWEEKGLSQKQAERILLPQSPHHWRMYARLQPLVPVARAVVILGLLFIAGEILWGNADALWGTVVATGVIIVLIITAGAFLFLFQKEKKEILRHPSYRQLFLGKLKK